jgi:hypothetical protein
MLCAPILLHPAILSTQELAKVYKIFNLPAPILQEVIEHEQMDDDRGPGGRILDDFDVPSVRATSPLPATTA